MDFSAFLVDSTALAAGWDDGDLPFLVIDLTVAEAVPDLRLPPCPVIGIGPLDHPLAPRLDTVVEAPVTLAMLAASIRANPVASAVLVQLLRGIEGQAPEVALVEESLAYGVLQAGAEHAAWRAGRQPEAPLASGALRVERVGDRLDLLIDRPEAHNAVDRPMRDALHEAFTLAALDPAIEAVTLSGAGKAFCMGADLAEFGTTRDPALAHMIRMRTLPAHAIVRCRDRLSIHVQGACVGSGLEMAAFANRLTATADAWFHLPELGMGLLPGAGGCVSLSHRIGRQRAALMILSGRRINARTALGWGLVDAIVDGD